ncbi:putative histone-lysine N-methyltransferase 1 [Calliphora vicina]|uniref:putative histone-lysine N-methyltransferase 1 n=1 Tax=Calliphora vicina TaxID=7373 RepID=UPI00325B1B85
MDWHLNLLSLLVLMPFVYSWSPIPSTRSSRSFYGSQKQFQQQPYQRQRNAVSPYLDLVLCPIREQPWSCARQQSARLLDIWDGELHTQWQKLKAEADRQLNSTLERRGYSDTTTLSKEKPSTILKKIEIGTNYMKEYLAETMDGFLGREYEYLQNTKNTFQTQNEEENEEQAEEYEEGDDDEEEEEEEDEQENNDHANQQTGDLKNSNNVAENSNNLSHDNDNDAEFIEIEEGEENNEDNDQENNDAVEELKKPGGGNKRRKKKKKKGSSQHDVGTQAANLLIIQPLEHQLASQHHDDGHGATQLLKPLAQKIKPSKQKKRKRKKGQHGGGHGGATSTFVVEQEPASDHFGLGLLEELVDLDGGDVGGKRKKKHPMKYGRSNGVTRGKKKKKKKALMKLMLLGSFLKAKIELLLKLLGAHLQIKFFAIALIGLLINIARFWIDVKRGGVPQKVVYVEHAHHQHHYEDHGDDWSESAGGGGGGGYWKRSLQTDSTENTYDSVTDSYQPKPLQPQPQQYDPQYMAYRSQWQRK